MEIQIPVDVNALFEEGHGKRKGIIIKIPYGKKINPTTIIPLMKSKMEKVAGETEEVATKKMEQEAEALKEALYEEVLERIETGLSSKMKGDQNMAKLKGWGLQEDLKEKIRQEMKKIKSTVSAIVCRADYLEVSFSDARTAEFLAIPIVPVEKQAPPVATLIPA